MTDDSEELRAALESRLPSTWTMRRLSAVTSGRSGSTSMCEVVPCLPLLVKPPLARSTSTATSAGSGLTGSVPVSIRGHVQQVCDQGVHVLGLVPDDADELAHHGGVQVRSRAHDRGGRPHDGGQGRPQLVAHHRQELGPQPLLLLYVGHVLHGDDHRLHSALVGEDGRGVEEHR